MDDRTIDRVFAEDVRNGLAAQPKHLNSRYFYDARGDELFQRIMDSPEYYLSDCEREILHTGGRDIAGAISTQQPFDLVELGSGDGSKFHLLLDALNSLDCSFTYRPVDISLNSLDLLEQSVSPRRAWLDMQSLHVNYDDWLGELRPDMTRRVFAFMGSNLGNFGAENAVSFLRRVRGAMGDGDALLIGLDLKKDPKVIRAAYNDAAGHTREFNLNLLQRINSELGGSFEPGSFTHEPEYCENTGAACSYLCSRERQSVRIAALGESIDFQAGERIFMEISQKYDQDMINRMAGESGFRVDEVFHDSRHWFTVQVWRPI